MIVWKIVDVLTFSIQKLNLFHIKIYFLLCLFIYLFIVNIFETIIYLNLLKK